MQKYKMIFLRALTVLGFASMLSLSAHAQKSKPAPNYEETVSWLQGVSKNDFMEIKPCEFSQKYYYFIRGLYLEDGKQFVNFGALHGTWGQYISDSFLGNRYHLKCANNKECTKRRDRRDHNIGKSDKGVESIEDGTDNEFIFYFLHGIEADRVSKALKHLTILCGAKVVNENAF